MVRVRFFGIVRDWMHCASMQVSADTVEEVLQGMREKGGWCFEEKALEDGGHLIPEMEFLVNGRNARFLQGPGTPLKPEDEVVVFIHRSWAEVPFM